MIVLNKDFSYWVGLLQSDGYVKGYKDFISGNKKRRSFVAGMEVKDRILVEKFQKTSNIIFNKDQKISYRSDHDSWVYDVSIGDSFRKLIELDVISKYPPKPPEWIKRDDKLFGAYLAGLIDGDGNVRIKRKKYPQCAIRIISSSPQNELKDELINKMKCAVSIIKKPRDVIFKNRRIKSTCYDLEFLVSPKNFDFLMKNVVPMISLERKRKPIEKYIKGRWVEQDLNLRFLPF